MIFQHLWGKRFQLKSRSQFSTFFGVLSSLPRVLGLVWSKNAFLTAILVVVNLCRGFVPIITIVITQHVIDSVVYGIKIHSVLPIWIPVLWQLVIGMLNCLLGVLNNITTKLLQERVGNRVRLMILEKTSTLDLAFFEQAEFYDKLRNASEEAHIKPVVIITQTCDLIRSFITMISLLFILLQLTWWLALISLIMPFPSFIVSASRGWKDYQRMQGQSSERRKVFYFNHVLTVDQFNKEVQLFNLSSFFLNRYRFLTEKLYRENKEIIVRYSLQGFIAVSLGVIANAGIYFYAAFQAVLGRISLGGLLLYTQSALQISSSFQGLLEGISNTYANSLFVNTLFSFLEYQPKILFALLLEYIRFKDVSCTKSRSDSLFRAFTLPLDR